MIFDTLAPLLLASSSPRRIALLQALGIDFTAVASDVEERKLDIPPKQLVEHWAKEKALAVARRFPSSWVLAADTIVTLDDLVLGKPHDRREAIKMLKLLSGRSHEVITGMCLVNRKMEHFQLQTVHSTVRIRALSSEEIEAYVSTGEPLDKAGAYAVQGSGAFLVEAIHGSYTNVVGLPLCETVNWLSQHRIIVPKRQ